MPAPTPRPAADVTVRHGQLLGVLGRACRAGDMTFCPALVEIDDPAAGHPLADFQRPDMLAFGEFELIDDAQPDALWVRGRLPGLFGYRPPHIGDGRVHLLDAGFVAVFDGPDGSVIVHPFAVTDEFCGHARLVLSGRETPDVRGWIAQRFWDLLSLRGVSENFRAEGLEWYAAFDEGGLDPEEVRWEVGLSRSVYYAECVAHDDRFDPDFERPDYSWHRCRTPVSRPVRLVRRLS